MVYWSWYCFWQVKCEFVNVTRWKVAICGEYMKSRFKVEWAPHFSSFYLSQSVSYSNWFVAFHYAFLFWTEMSQNFVLDDVRTLVFSHLVHVNLESCPPFLLMTFLVASFQTCSHGTACNFIHCFRNPGGDYEWADIDKPPPKYWVKKMAALFGYSDEAGYEKQVEQENLGLQRYSSKMSTDDRCAYSFSSRCCCST
jgi:hypothetical protein